MYNTAMFKRGYGFSKRLHRAQCSLQESGADSI